MKKIDYKKESKHLYQASQRLATIIDVPSMHFLMIDGKGDPNTSQSFSEAVACLYAISYSIKFSVKRGGYGIDYPVLPLEALWWADDMAVFKEGRKDHWSWTMMIRQPDIVSQEMVSESMREVKMKKDPVALSKVRFEQYHEGRSAQILHVGPFSEEGATIEKLHEFITSEGFQLRGKHHELYLSDMRRAAPNKWKTIVRQPVQ